MIKKKQIVYKVVKVVNSKMVSTNTSINKYTVGIIPNKMLLEYKLNEETFPSVGKIFCFLDLKEAQEWKAKMSLDTILKGYASNTKKCTFKKILNANNFNYIDTFWDTNGKTLCSYDNNTGWLVPSGTYLCDSFIPTEII